jgi:hypothetical protein
MAYQKLQQGRAINVIPSDDINIPSPSAVAAVGANQSTNPDYIENNDADFFKSVKVNDTVYNTTSNQISYVVEIQSEKIVKIANPIFSSGDEYKIFSTVDVRTEPCVLYIGTTASVTKTLRVLTADKDIVTLVAPAAGFVIPLQVLRVFETGTDITDIVALW